MSDDGLVAALARAQGKFPPIVKSQTATVQTKTGGKYQYSYADLAVIIGIVRPVLAAEGIVVTQATACGDEGGVVLVTSLMYGNAGESLSSEFPLYVSGLNAQEIGSLMTYQRRYQLCALLGVHPEGDDDDGNAAQTAPSRSSEFARLEMNKVQGDPYVLAAANPPEKPLAAMTAGEMARYGESIGVRVTGSKADILRTLQPYVLAATGEEPFETTGAEPIEPKPDDHDKPFTPTTFDDEMKMKTPDVRRSMTRKGD